MNPPRCPVCKAILSADRAIDEQWIEGRDGAESQWIYRYACRGCVSVVAWVLPETRSARPPVGYTRVDLSATIVVRAIEELRSSSDIVELTERTERVRADPTSRLLLRVPEVFAVARSAWGGEVYAAEPLVATMLVPRMLGAGARLTLHRPLPAPEDPYEEPSVPPKPPIRVQSLDADPEGPFRIRVAPEVRLRVTGVDGSRFVLDAEPIATRWEMPWIETLLAWPDLVVPATPLP